MPREVPVYEPDLTEDDAEAVANAIRSGWISASSPVVSQFEKRFAESCGSTAAVSASSGTTALELALMALRIGPGDEVLCPSLTIISCARAILAVGARPVFVDVDPKTFCLDVDQAVARCGPRTKAVLAVHLFGHPVDLEKLEPLRAGGVRIIEDAAQALGSRVRVGGDWHACGSVGDVGAFSFYANKLITTAEGGMLVGRDPDVIDRARQAGNLFFGREQRFVHDELGHNYRMSGLHAALGLSQMNRLPWRIERRHAVDSAWRKALGDVDGLRFQTTRPWARPVPWMTALVVEDRPASELAAQLREEGIETRPFFAGLHRQPALEGRMAPHDPAEFVVTEHLTRHGLYLPSSPSLTDEEIARMADVIRTALRTTGTRSRLTTERSAASGSEPLHRPPDATVFGQAYASVYDRFYADKPYEDEARTVLRLADQIADRHGGPSPVSRILDVGCGTGRHARAFAEAGRHVTGVDLSADMLAEARRRCAGLANVEFVHSDLENLALDRPPFDAPPFDAATMLFAVLGYLNDDDLLVRSLRTLRRHLRTGAVLVADYWNATAVSENPPSERVATVVTDSGLQARHAIPVHRPEQRLVEVTYRLDGAGNEEKAATTERHVMRYFDEADLRRLLGSAGFEPVRFSGWPDPDGPPSLSHYPAVVIARAV